MEVSSIDIKILPWFLLVFVTMPMPMVMVTCTIMVVMVALLDKWLMFFISLCHCLNCFLLLFLFFVAMFVLMPMTMVMITASSSNM